MKIKTILFILSLSILFNLSAQDKKVLFVGNSYTDVNNLPLMVRNLSSSMGKTLKFETQTMGGAQFSTHWNNIETSGLLEKIQTGNFDYIVLQGQSQEVAFPDGQFNSSVYPYAKKLDSLINLYSPQTKVVFYMTWGYRYGDQQNCPYYPPFCTYFSMSERLYQNYSLMAQDFGSLIAPVGAAWRASIIKDSTLVLHSGDNSHPSVAGTYLASCVFYSTFFQDSVYSQDVPSGMSATDCAYLQNISNTIIFDSLAYWLQSENLCDNPRNLSQQITYSTTDTSSAICNLSWSSTSPSYDLRYKTISEENWQRVVVNQNSHQLNLPSGNWQWRIKSLCDSTSQSFWVDTSFAFTASLDEISQIAPLFNVYYSEKEGKINIEIENIFEDLEIEVIDLRGQTQKRLNTKPKSGKYRTEININNLSTGLYIVNIKSNSATNSFKIIKN